MSAPPPADSSNRAPLRGAKKAIVAVAASILTAIYHMLKYLDLGPNHFDRRSKERQKNRLVKRLTDLGYEVQLAPLPA